MNRIQWIKHGIMNGYNPNTINTDAFITTWNMTATTTTLTSQTVSANNCTVNWGDGTITNYNGINPSHTYTTAGQYTIIITGQYTGFRFLETNASKLISVNQWGNVGFTSLNSFFYNCSNLISLPDGAITGVNNIANATACFGYCSSLTSVPNNLFDNCVNITDFSQCFTNCKLLTSIPNNLFNLHTNVTNFNHCFSYCSSLISISNAIFNTCTKVTDFSYCFHNCKSLTSIPTGLFDNCISVTNFKNCFYTCSSLTSIPNNLFNNHINVTDFRDCFAYCRKLTLPTVIFNLTALQTKKPNMSECFTTDSTTNSPTGTIQPIWNYITITSKNYCFYNCTGISNYSTIPSLWKDV